MTDATIRFGSLRQWAWRFAKGSIILLVIGAVVYWLRFSPIPVASYSPQRGPIIAEVIGTGTLEARVSTTISPKISGRIAQVLVDQGDTVEKGKLLVQLDDEELQQQVAIAQANKDAADAAVVRLKADKDRAIAVFEQAQRSHTRTRTLSERDAASLEELERAAESLAVATADMARAEAAITEGQKGLIAADKTFEYHRARLTDTHINAPFAGIIILRHREAGDVAVPGSAVLTLISTDVLWIKAWVDETQMARLNEGQSVRVVFRSQPNKSYLGKVTRMGKQADRETREFVVDIQVMELPPNWAVGQRAEVYIETDKREGVLTIPTHLLTRRGQIEGVFVAENGVARWRTLTVGLRGRESVELVEGLTESDVVILPQQATAQLDEGRKVQLP